MSPTTIVRRAMYTTGASKSSVFTNRYEKCHTVKMYGGSDEYNQQVIETILALGIPGLTAKVLPSKRVYAYYSQRPSIIARIPR